MIIYLKGERSMEFYDGGDDGFFDDGFDEFGDDSFDEFSDDSFDEFSDFYGNEKKHKDTDYIETFDDYKKDHTFDLYDFNDDTDSYRWRSFYLGHPELGIYPESYETEKEYKDALSKAQYPWREYCEDGFKFGVNPEDYKTEEEYKNALNHAKYDWRLCCDDPMYTGIDPKDYETEKEYQDALSYALESVDDEENNIGITLNFSVECPALDKLDEIKEEDYPNKRRYNAAYTLANEFLIYCDDECEKENKACCRFILDKADTIIAANYLSYNSGFLFAQAIKDNFTVPCSLPDEDEKSEIDFYKILYKIAKKDIPLSFEIWSWCLEQFLPYSEYDEFCTYALTGEVIFNIYDFPEGYTTKLVHYMNDNDDFCKLLLSKRDEPLSDFPKLVVEAIKEKLFKTADFIFNSEFERIKKDWKMINEYTKDLISGCLNYKELETIEYFRDNYFPIIKAIPLGMVQDEIEDWEEEISRYIDYLEDNFDQYAFARKNAWRKNVPDGKEFGLDPRNFDSEEDYLKVYNYEKYYWREYYQDDDTYGLNPENFETEDEFQEALDDKLKEIRQQEQEKRLREQQLAKQAKTQEYENDKTIYTYCGVLFSNFDRPYSFRTEDNSIKIGDTVIVPVGKNQKEIKGTVVSVGQYLRVGVPYPVEKTKLILRKVDNETD